MKNSVIMAGFGGQGILLIGNMLAYAGLEEGKQVTYMPAYGVEMRGGTANCTVVVADEPIGSPIVGKPDAVIVMNLPSLKKFESWIKPGGILLFNTSLVPTEQQKRTDITAYPVPANDLATEMGNARLANMILIGAYVAATGVVSQDSLINSLSKVISERNARFIPQNIEAIKLGAQQIAGLKN
ncbi:MAG: 2-oxoacid:ferredoxin oxidoreductase subunit gamma [Deltaproteobacteria bacterium]|nr:MAG: 2-oxoacid:ferredoxin oxidoreductase subunit gamma [Deltaproteobacteria bacterium]